MTFQLRRDTNNVPVTGYDERFDVLRHVDASGSAILLTNTPLASGAVWTQTAVDRFGMVAAPVGGYESKIHVLLIDQVSGLIWADQAGTLILRASDNGSSWSTLATVSVSAATTAILPWTKMRKRYYQFRYTNGGVDQQEFILLSSVRSGSFGDTKTLGSSETATGTLPMVGTSPTALGSSWSCVSVDVQCDPDSTNDIYLGDSSSQPVHLLPGMGETIQVADVSQVYVKTATGTGIVNWFARN